MTDWQAMLCAYHQRLKDHPFFEATRAICPSVRVQTSPSTWVIDRMNQVIDWEIEATAQDQAVHIALDALPLEDRNLCLHLAAYPERSPQGALQFDFGRAASCWTEGQRGPCPYPGQPGYEAWRSARLRRSQELRDEWKRVKEALDRSMHPELH